MGALPSLCSVYSGHQSILIPPSELEANPSLWLSAVSQYKVRDTFCSYSVMELCTKSLGLQTDALKVGLRRSSDPEGRFDADSDLQSRGLDLSRVRTCVVVAEERPRTALTQSFSKLFKDLGLHPRAVSTSFGCRVNLAICLQVGRSLSGRFLLGSACFGPVLSAGCGFLNHEPDFFDAFGLWGV